MKPTREDVHELIQLIRFHYRLDADGKVITPPIERVARWLVAEFNIPPDDGREINVVLGGMSPQEASRLLDTKPVAAATTVSSSSTKNEIEEMITDVEACHLSLSDWEASFIDSIRKQWNRNKSLSDRQITTLTKIWEKRT